MKKIFILVMLLVLFSLTSCGALPLEEPENNLEFWIGENVNGIDFSSYHHLPGFGSDSYVNSKYEAVYDKYNYPTFPNGYVEYTVGSFPDESSLSKHIICIEIIDPNIYLYGLSINTPFDELVSVMENHSFKVTNNLNYIRAKYDKYTFSFEKGRILISILPFLLYSLQ